MKGSRKRRTGETENTPQDSPFPRSPASPPPASTNLHSPILNPQSWQCLSVTVPHEATEAVANFLVELGSLGVMEGARDLQRPEPTTEVQGFFPKETAGATLFDALTRYLQDLAEIIPTLGFPTPRLTTITNDAWHNRWQEHFPPLAVGKRFLILPPWEQQPFDTERIPIVIDPSMAFGTGHHATTQGCLEAIELVHEQYGAPNHALDLGTGSGILAIALVKLGASHVWATDIDPIALLEAEKNSEANHVADAIQLSDLPLDHLPRPFTLIVANLFSSTLVALAPALTLALTPQGHLILSGIQLDQESDVLAAYPAPTWSLVKRFPKEEWVTLVMQRT